MNLIIFGPPGSGKGTYASRLEQKIKIKKISTGDIFREIAKQNTKLGKKIADIITKGKLVPDEIVIEIIKEELKKIENRNFILDGYPRTVKQGKALDKLVKIDAVILINAHEEILVEKICARRICSNPECDGNYNLADIRKTIDSIEYVLPPILPKNDMKCDKCGEILIQRKDDNEEVIKKRLRIYKKQTKPVLEYYKNKKVPIVEVWMNRSPEEVVERIIEKLKEIKIL